MRLVSPLNEEVVGPLPFGPLFWFFLFLSFFIHIQFIKKDWCRKVRHLTFPGIQKKSRMTAFKRRVRTGRGRLSKPNETRRNMGTSTIPMSAFVSKSQKAALSLYLGLGLASSQYISIWRKFGLVVVRELLPKCIETCEGRSRLVSSIIIWWERQAKLNKIIYWCYYRILWIARGTLSISPLSTRLTA